MIKTCYVGVKGIIRVQGKCLVLKQRNASLAYWDAPGGRIEGSESLEDALAREIREELPEIGSFQIKEVIGAHRLSFDPVDDKGLVFIFFLVDAESFEVVAPEHEGYTWIDGQNIGELQKGDYAIEPKYLEAISRACALG